MIASGVIAGSGPRPVGSRRASNHGTPARPLDGQLLTNTGSTNTPSSNRLNDVAKFIGTRVAWLLTQKPRFELAHPLVALQSKDFRDRGDISLHPGYAALTKNA